MLLPKSVSKIIAVFRGDVSPVLILLSATLGFWFGLTPGWYGLHVALLVLVLILNVHVGLFVMFAAVGKALCYAAAPVLYYTGQWVHTHLAGVLDALASLPVVGITDYSRYAVAGAVLIGPVGGLVLGLLLARSVGLFRRAWLTLDEGSEAFRKWQSRGWVRFLDRLLIGKRAKDVRAVLKRRPRIIRLAGVGAALVVILGAAIGLHFLQEQRLADLAAESLTRANGAEVNITSLEVAPFSGRVVATGVQVTDPEVPSQNRLAFAELTADASLANLLRGRLVMDNVVLSDIAIDEARETPGTVLVERPPASDEFDPVRFSIPDVDVATLQSYLKHTEQVRGWLERISSWLPPGQDDLEPTPEAPPVPEHYLAYLTARAPVAPAPRIVVRRLELADVAIPADQIGRSTITCVNVSDAPAAAALPLTIHVASHERPAEIDVVCHYDRPEGGAEITGTIGDIDLSELQASLNPRNPVTLEGGTASVRISGRATRTTIDVAFHVQTQGMRARSAGGRLFDLDPRVTSEALQALENLETTLRLVGPITEPRLVFDVESLKAGFRDALINAGKNELARQLGDVIGEDLAGTLAEPEKVLEDPLGKAGGLIDDVLSGRKSKDKQDATSKPAEEEKKKDKDDPLSRLRGRLKKP